MLYPSQAKNKNHLALTILQGYGPVSPAVTDIAPEIVHHEKSSLMHYGEESEHHQGKPWWCLGYWKLTKGSLMERA